MLLILEIANVILLVIIAWEVNVSRTVIHQLLQHQRALTRAQNPELMDETESDGPEQTSELTLTWSPSVARENNKHLNKRVL